MTYKDIPGWFPPESAATLERLIAEHHIKTVLEVGTFFGRSAVFFAGLVDHVTVVDTFIAWPGTNAIDLTQQAGIKEGDDFSRLFIHYVDQCGVGNKMNVAQTESETFANGSTTTYDFIYIDASHDYESVKKDLELWKDRANVILCGDDYDENWPGVKQAVDELIPDKQVEGRVWFAIK